MKRLISYGRFGAFYGSWSGASIGVLFVLYATAYTLYHWPKDGTVRWFIEGTLSILFFSLIAGYILGFIGGFVFGLIGSFASNPFGWSIGGVVGGVVSSWFFLWLSWLMIRKPNIPDFSSFWLSRLPMNLLPSIVLGAIGWMIGRAICRNQDNIPRLNWIRNL